MNDSQADTDGLRALLRWYADMGVDDVVDLAPSNQFDRDDLVRRSPRVELENGTTDQRGRDRNPGKTSSRSAVGIPTRISGGMPVSMIAPSTLPSADEAVAQAVETAARSNTIEELRDAIQGFEGCALKSGARNTVFCDGSEDADLLVIGEAPGRDEDRIGKPFVGRAGQLLDRMLAAIGRDRTENALISNVIFWRPPGNRTPTQTEVAICKPFVDRLICLQKPKVIMLAGGAPTQAMLGLSGIMRARGTWRTIETADGTSVPTLPMLHPAFLLRQPAAKKLAWHDLLTLQARLMDD